MRKVVDMSEFIPIRYLCPVCGEWHKYKGEKLNKEQKMTLKCENIPDFDIFIEKYSTVDMHIYASNFDSRMEMLVIKDEYSSDYIRVSVDTMEALNLWKEFGISRDECYGYVILSSLRICADKVDESRANDYEHSFTYTKEWYTECYNERRCHYCNYEKYCSIAHNGKKRKEIRFGFEFAKSDYDKIMHTIRYTL